MRRERRAAGWHPAQRVPAPPPGGALRRAAPSNGSDVSPPLQWLQRLSPLQESAVWGLRLVRVQVDPPAALPRCRASPQSP